MSTYSTEQQAPANNGQKIMANLDEFERETTYELFAFGFQGRRIELIDPAELDWQDLANLQDETQFVKLAITNDEDLGFFLAAKVPAWKIRDLIDLYFKHYGIDADTGKPRG